MKKWIFPIAEENLDTLPGDFARALNKRIEITDYKINTNDDDGWGISGRCANTSFRIVCRNELTKSGVNNVIWCEGVSRSLLGFLAKPTAAPDGLLDAVVATLREDIRVVTIEEIDD